MNDDLSYTWPYGKKAAAILSIDFDGPSPYLWATRDKNTTALGELELRRFGPRQGIYRLLELFGRFDLRISAYVPGAVALSRPTEVAALLEAGHEVGLHGFMHEKVTELEFDQLKIVLNKSARALEAVGAIAPFGYRSPSWELTTEALHVLEEFGVAYDSSLMGFDQPYWMSNLIEVPVQWPLDDAIYYRYVPGSNWPPVTPRELTAGWKLELEGAKRYGSLVTLTLHPWLSGRAGRMLAIEELLEEFRYDEEIWWATAKEVAEHHRLTYGNGVRHLPRIGEI